MASTLSFDVNSSSAIYDHLNAIVTDLNSGDAALVPRFTGAEPPILGAGAAPGTPVVTQKFFTSATVSGGGGGANFAFPTAFAGVTHLSAFPMRQHTVCSYWSMNGTQVILTMRDAGSGAFLPDGTTVQCCIEVTGWV